MNEKVAIIIPTKNRSEFLIRQLKYYKSVKNHHPIYIGDSSNENEKRKFLDSLDDFRNFFDVHYFNYPNVGSVFAQQVIFQLSLKVKEKYCVFLGDDDFLIPNSLTKCANFLEKNHDYRTAQGKSSLFSLRNKGAYGPFNYFEEISNEPQSLEDLAKDRIINYANGHPLNFFNPQFSVHRTEEFIKDSESYKINRDPNFTEYLHCFTFIARGKSKFIDCLYLIRQVHENRLTLPNFLEHLENPYFYESYNLFINSISQILVKEDGLDISEARSLVNNIYWIYNLRSSKAKNEAKKDYLKNYRYLIFFKDVMKKIIPPYLVDLIKEIKSTIMFNYRKAFKKSNHYYLMSNKNSKYYSDFSPLYKIIINKN